MYILNYDFAAIILNIINIAVFYYKKNLYDSKSKILLFMLINSFFATAFDIFSSYVMDNPSAYSYWFVFISNNFYYLLNNSKIYIYAAYTLELNGRWRTLSRLSKLLSIIPFAFTTLFIIFNPITKSIFDFDHKMAYQQNSGLIYLYIIDGIFLIITTISTIRHKKLLNRPTFRALIFFVFIFLFTVIGQTYNPRIPIQCIGTALCELVLIMILQDRNKVIDSVTGLYNHNSFYNKLRFYFDGNIPFSITLIMLEDTSRISYTLGYQYINLINKETARFIKEELDTDEKYYVRSNCFALLSVKNIQKRTPETKSKIMERFQDSWRINEMDLSLSARICQLSYPDNLGSLSDLFDYIDFISSSASLPSKKHSIGVSEVSISKRKREQELRRIIAAAIINRSFEVYYQPIYSVQDKVFNSAEALVRLRDPLLGFIPPDEFIPLTERDGSITKIGLSIFEMVCSFIQFTNLESKGLRFIEVNLSVVQCLQSDIKKQLVFLMQKYKIRPDQICLEITETVAINSPEVIRVLFNELNRDGMTFALDDFGDGYSNINYLLELPFHFVKLDKSIVWAYFRDDQGKIALESTIALMKSLNIELIAEGVETKEQSEALISLGVEYLQGYYFSKPIPSEDFLLFIEEHNTALQNHHVMN